MKHLDKAGDRLEFKCPKCSKTYDAEYRRRNTYCSACQMRLIAKQSITPQKPDLLIKKDGYPELGITSSDVWSFFKRLDSAHTLSRHNKFRMSRALGDSVWIIPEDTGVERPIKFEDFLNVWNRYVTTRSERVSDYQEISRNASYVIAVITSYLKSIQ